MWLFQYPLIHFLFSAHTIICKFYFLSFISCKKFTTEISQLLYWGQCMIWGFTSLGERTVWNKYGYKEVPYFLCFCSIEGRNPLLTPRTPIFFCIDEQLFYKCMLSNHSSFFEAIDYFSSHIHWAQDLFVCWSTWSPHSEQLLSVKRLINKNA